MVICAFSHLEVGFWMFYRALFLLYHLDQQHQLIAASSQKLTRKLRSLPEVSNKK
jgi:hypothetical protein